MNAMQGVDLSSMSSSSSSDRASMNQSEMFKGAIEEAIKTNGLGDRIQYDWGLTAAPAPNGQLMPVYVLTMSMPTLVIGEMAQSLAMIAASGLTVEAIGELVKSAIEEMRERRDEQRNSIS